MRVRREGHRVRLLRWVSLLETAGTGRLAKIWARVIVCGKWEKL